MIAPGEVRCYVGGRHELYAVGEVFCLRWVAGVMVCKARYGNRAERTRIIDKMVETWKDIEVAILPDDIDFTMAEIKNNEADIKWDTYTETR